MEKYSKAVREMYSQFKKVKPHPMEKYSKAVREMYSQFKKVKPHPMEKYVGRHVLYFGHTLEVVGYRRVKDSSGMLMLIVEAPKGEGWKDIGPRDVIFKACECYWYASTFDLIDW